ncbi:hypothetical protein QFC22_004595 [Naganishia vaughanmartiniae]|uniref:Uncharacterized protein n=1 Tax=Naganishia vaughanmartiniae TaxID=1424756 RepID=A0ACC2X0Z4_9TREE|nr:hypothetical protein QFC22_004595 [Naganishia vaughanmartiniae]
MERLPRPHTDDSHEDWSNDGDFVFDSNDTRCDPGLVTTSTKAHLRPPTLSHAFQTVSPNVQSSSRTVKPRAMDQPGSGDNSGVIASSSSGNGSTFTSGSRYADMDDMDMMDDEADVGYSTIKGLDARGPSSQGTLSSVNGGLTVQAKVTGTALNGRAFITRLGSTNSKIRTSQPEPELEEDFDWDEDVQQVKSTPLAVTSLHEKLKHRLAHQHTDNIRPGSADLDDFDFDDDSDVGEEARQTTLKAGTITYQAVVAQARSQMGSPLIQKPKLTHEEEDMEDGFQLPLTLKHLKLVSRSPQPAIIRHRSSRSSLASAATSRSTSDWDNVGTPGNARTRTPDERSEASSRTSSVVIPGTDQSETEQHPMDRAEQELETDDDLEHGLELPMPSFFSGGRARELNRLLDQKRKPELSLNRASEGELNEGSGNQRGSLNPWKPTLSSTNKFKYVIQAQDRIEDHLEDGLVLQDERTELTHGRLARIRQTRANTGTPTGPRNAAGGTLKRGFITGRQRVESIGRKDLVQSLQPSRSATSSSSLATPLRSRTARPTSPPTNAFIPPPDVASTTPSRLRHQKSHSRLGQPPPSSALGKRQSMSSIREMANLHETTGYSTYHPPVPSVQSYTAQTAASAARSSGKIRNSSTGSDEWGTTRSRTSSDHSSTVRSTPSTGANRTVKPRPLLSSAFAPDTRADHASSTRSPSVLIAHQLKTPRSFRPYGDGTELDTFEDLQVDRAKEGMLKVPKGSSGAGSGSFGRSAGLQLGLGRPPRSGRTSPVKVLDSNITAEKRKKHPFEPVPAPRQAATSKGKPLARKAGLIRHLGRVEKKKVGDMTWNPETLRWEGNYQVLRDFDAQVMSSARPALITHYAAFSSMNTMSSRSTLSGDKTVSAGTAAAASSIVPPSTLNAVRVVGNMMFDPVKMCWVSTLPVEEDEPDPFANIEDEGFTDTLSPRASLEEESEDDVAFMRGGTITKDTGKSLIAGIRSRAAAMRFSSAATTSSITSAATSVGSRNERRRGDGMLAGGGGMHDEMDEDWDADTGAASVNPDLPRTSLYRTGRNTSSRFVNQTDSGFRVKTPIITTSTDNTADSPDLKPSSDQFHPTRYITQQLLESTIAAVARHEREMLGWRVAGRVKDGWTAREWEKERERERRREEKRLWEIRNLAMRSSS